MRSKRTALCVAAVLLLAGCSGSDSGPGSGSGSGDDDRSSAPATTRCRGSIGAEKVTGALLVPRNRTCRLDGTTVVGRVTVSTGATLVARKAQLLQGLGAHGFERVELHDVRAGDGSEVTDFVMDSGADVVVRDGPANGQYYVIDNTGRVELVGMYLDLGRIYCADNDRRPVVRGIAAETPGVLQGQCAGLRNFGDTDF